MLTYARSHPGRLATARTGMWLALPATLLLAVFALDLSQHVGILFSILYVLPIVATIGIDRPQATYLVFVVASVATVAAAAFNTPATDPALSLGNRALALLAQVLAAVAVIQQLELRNRHYARARDHESRLAQAGATVKSAGVRAASLESLIQALPEGICMFDTAGVLVEINEAGARLLDLGANHLVGRHWADLAALIELRTTEGQPFDPALALRRWPSPDVANLDVEVRLRRARSGEFLRCLLSAAALRGPDGQIREGVVILRDITVLRALERQKDEFVSMATHELRTPLSTIRGYVQLAQTAALRAEQPYVADTIGKTLRQVDRLNLLVTELLDVSRIQAGQIDLRLTPLDLSTLIREAVEEQRAAHPYRSLTLQEETADALVRADNQRLEQVLTNLLDNAIKYSPDGGIVQVRLWTEGQELLVSVTDQGVGIPFEEQQRLFQRFYRGKSGAKRFSGLGVGLYISHEIIRRHGGRMWVESTPQKGSSFGFALPSLDEAQRLLPASGSVRIERKPQ